MQPSRVGLLLLLVLALCPSAGRSQPSTPGSGTGSTEESPRTSMSFQLTIISQGHPAFPATYMGKNSLSSGAESSLSLTTTLFLGLRTWQGGEFWVNPEVAGG